jgi:hypothetical protein
MEVFARSWHANRKKLPLPHAARINRNDGRAVKRGTVLRAAAYLRGRLV